MERTNPIIEPYHTEFEIPPFDQIKVEDIIPALVKGREETKTIIDKIINNPEKATFENTILPLEHPSFIFERANRIYRCFRRSFMISEFLATEKEISNLITEVISEISMNTKLFIRIKYLFDNIETLGLDESQRLLVEKKYEKFVREGALLSDQDKSKLKDLNIQLLHHFADFSKNLVKYRNDFFYIIDDEKRLKGLPKKTIIEAANEAKKRKLEGKWAFTLCNVSTVLEYAEDRDFRQQMHQAYTSQASSGEFNNIPVIKEIIKIRSEKAHLLGFENFAAYQTANVMGKTPQNAIDPLMRIWKPAIKKFKEELAEIQSIADSENPKGFKIEPWDWDFYARKVYEKKYNIDEKILEQYFSLESILKGLFSLAKRLYGISFKELKNAPRYYPDIQVYEVLDENDQHLGIFNTDFFYRPIKRIGWWTSTMKVPYIDSNNVNHRPIVSIVCDLKKPVEEGYPCLLPTDDVKGLFHEFGHALHFIFSQARYASQYSEYADRDFLEFPSQINEHWSFEPELLKEYAHHWKTGEPIPDDMIEKLKLLPHHNAGYKNIRNISTSYLDMKYGMIPNKDIDKIDILKFEENIRNELCMPHEIEFIYRGPYFRHTFECEDYACGVYTYKWTEILDTFAFELFKEKGVFDKETALSFRKNILEMGASEDPMKLFVKFRGCEPKTDAILKYYGFTD